MWGAAIVLVVVLGTAGSTGAASRNVTGSMTGPGGFRQSSCAGGTADEIGSGTYTSTGLGTGTYAFDACITQTTSGFSFSGKVKFVTGSGAKLRGAISGTSSGPGNPSFTVTVQSGTQRFVRATGVLVIGPFTETNQTNCAHGVCADFTDTGPVSGTLHHVIKP